MINRVQLVNKIFRAASRCDQYGLYEYADVLTGVLIKLAEYENFDDYFSEPNEPFYMGGEEGGPTTGDYEGLAPVDIDYKSTEDLERSDVERRLLDLLAIDKKNIGQIEEMKHLMSFLYNKPYESNPDDYRLQRALDMPEDLIEGNMDYDINNMGH